MSLVMSCLLRQWRVLEQRSRVALQLVVVVAWLLQLCLHRPGSDLIEWVKLLWPAATKESVSTFLQVVTTVCRWCLSRCDTSRRSIRRRDKKHRRQ